MKRAYTAVYTWATCCLHMAPRSVHSLPSPSVFTGPLPSSRVPFRLHGSPSSSRVPFRLHGSPSVFTGPLPSSRVPFLLHGSPSFFTGPLPSSRVPFRLHGSLAGFEQLKCGHLTTTPLRPLVLCPVYIIISCQRHAGGSVVEL